MSAFKSFLSVFRIRNYPNLQTLSPPAYLVSGLLIPVSFVFYFLSKTVVEEMMRYSVLATTACSVCILLIHWLSPVLARWLVSAFTTILVFGLASIWQETALLYLLAVPVILAAVLVNWPAALLIAAAETALVMAIPSSNPLVGPGQVILILLIWLSALLTGGGYAFVERVLEQANSDYDRLQTLLIESRQQQQKLSETLGNLEHANRQLSLLYEKNIALRKTAEEATEAKTTYIARVSHEIRTPLNMILGITESIIENHEIYEDELPLDLVDDIRVVRRNSEHLLSLVNDVLDLTRADSSRLILHKEWLDIGEEIDKSLEIVLPLARKKKLELQFVPTHPLPQVFCDRTRIRQVVLNLLSNAVRYTEKGGVFIQASADENWLTVQVKDTGPGIETVDAERIFEPFYRGSTSVQRESIGTGLGLSVSRQLIDLHGGKVWLESRPNEGSTFAFRLPLAPGGDVGRSPISLISEQWVWVERKRERAYSFKTSQKKRIMVYGPEELLAGADSGLSDKADIQVVKTVAELIEEVITIPAHLIIINGQSLEELGPKLKEITAHIKDTPIIGSVFDSLGVQVAKAGAIDYVQKPFNNQRLRQAVAQVRPYPRRILIVDDNVEVQRLMVRVLTMQDETTQYLLAENGQRAVEIARRKKPDLILLDLALPEMDGWQFLAVLRKDEELRDIPVILVSAHDLSDSPSRSQAVVLMDGNGVSMEKFLGLVKGSLQLPL